MSAKPRPPRRPVTTRSAPKLNLVRTPVVDLLKDLVPLCACRSCNPPPPDARTWWRGVENPARQVEGRFGTVWRPLVEIVWMGQRPIYLDDAEGKGWRKVTEGKASPQWAHVELIPQEVRDRG